ncbi:MAG: transglycosylase domain-containing protein, partial [Nocardioidaceae bacterium]|nr:transglycosylase domain-containing protein [Nocardioidaceae bacterium]
MSSRSLPDGSGIARAGSKLLSMVGVSALCGVLVAGLLLPIASVLGITTRNLAEGFQNLPLALQESAIPQRTTVLDREGKPIAYFYKENRTDVRLSQVSAIMRRSMVAIEDSRFYDHGAIDVKGTIRALINNLANGATQGGSSITQQLIKMLLLEQAETAAERREATEQSFGRKWRELQYAMAYEQTHTKNEILRNYLNTAYFGDGAYGIDSAAHHYFSVDPSELSLPQSSLLAGLVKNPTQYDPTDYPEEATDRRNTVLGRMAELGIISDARARKVAGAPLALDLTRTSNGCVSTIASFFCDYVRRYLLEQEFLGGTRDERLRQLETGGLTITTTLDRDMQRVSDAAVREHVYATDRAIGALALVEPGTGEVRALAQSRPMGRDENFGQTYLNYTVPREFGDGRGFQAGSTFKAFVLATALRKGISPKTTITAPFSLTQPEGTYQNCDGLDTEEWKVESSTSTGTMDMYRGTRESVNTFYAQLEAFVGVCPSVTTARAMGIEVPTADENGPFTLGATSVSPLSMAAAYATFGSRGIYCEPHPVTEVLNAQGAVVGTVADDCKRVFRPLVADTVNDILRGVQEPGGFGYDIGDAGLEIDSAAKTGTIQNNAAVWYMGYTPDLVTAAMIAGANEKGQPITLNGQTVGGTLIASASGSGVAAPMWKSAMGTIQRWLPGNEFVEPDLDRFKGGDGTVPTVAGKSVDRAIELLRKAGYFPQVGYSVSSNYSAGTVAYTSPGAGTEAARGETVYIYPSTGYIPPPPEPDPEPGPGPNNPGPPDNPGGGDGDNPGG